MKRVMTIMTAAGLAAGLAAGQTAADGMRAARGKAKAGEFDGARAAYQTVAAAYPASACHALREAAQCLASAGKHGEALAEFNALTSTYGTRSNEVIYVYACISSMHQKLGDYGKALAACDEAFSKYPGMRDDVRVGLLGLKAGALILSGNHAAAAAELEAAFALAPPGEASVRTCRALAKTYGKMAKHKEAQDTLRKGIAANAAASGTAAAGLFDLVDPASVTADRYREFLKDVILRTPAVEENAKFLGRLKSELEKIRE